MNNNNHFDGAGNMVDYRALLAWAATFAIGVTVWMLACYGAWTASEQISPSADESDLTVDPQAANSDFTLYSDTYWEFMRAHPDGTVDIFCKDGPVATILADGTVTIHKEGGDKEAAKALWLAVQQLTLSDD